MVTPTLPPDVRARVQRRTVLLLSLAQVFSGVGAGTVLSTGSLLAVEMSGSNAWAGSVSTALTLGAAIASALLSRLALARGRRPALATGLLVATFGAFGVVLAGVLGFFPLLILSGALMGFGNASNLQARFAATDLSEPAHRGRDLSLVVWMSTVGAVVGPNLIGTGRDVAATLGIPTLTGLFVIAAAGMILGMTVLWVGLRPDPYLASTGRPRTVTTTATTATTTATPDTASDVPEAVDTQRPAAAGFAAGVRALRRHPGARTALIGIVAAHAVMVAVMSMTPVHLTGHGASVTIVGLTVSLHIAGMYALAPVMGVLTDRLGARVVVAGGMVTLVVSVLLAGFSGASHVVTTAGLILLGLGWSAATVAGSALLVVSVPDAERVAAQGAADSLMSLAGAAGGALAGIALAAVGYPGLGVASAAVAVAALVVVVTVRGRPVELETTAPHAGHAAPDEPAASSTSSTDITG